MVWWRWLDIILAAKAAESVASMYFSYNRVIIKLQLELHRVALAETGWRKVTLNYGAL